MGIIDSIKHRLPEDVVALGEATAEGRTHWGRILYIDPLGLGRARIRLEIHDLDLPPVQRWVSTRIPRGMDPRVGDDVYCKRVDGTFAGVEIPYRIHWDRPPQYGETSQRW